MKKILALLAAAFIVITVCMLYLVRRGVSLRAAPVIRPSPVHEDLENVAYGTVLRLFPQFQKNHYVLFGALPETPQFKKIRELMREAFEKQHAGQKVNWIEDIEKATVEDVKACSAPCWILFPLKQASELAPHDAVESKIKPLGRSYFTMSFLEFRRHVPVPENCLDEKRLTYDCLAPVLANESERKMKDPAQRYFFVRSYNERDYFLMLQEPL